MARFDVHRLGDATLVVNCQSDLLDGLNTRAVVPLLPRDLVTKPIGRLNPEIEVDGEHLVMATQFIAAVPVRELGPKIASLQDRDAEVSAALDMLFIGF